MHYGVVSPSGLIIPINFFVVICMESAFVAYPLGHRVLCSYVLDPFIFGGVQFLGV